MKKEWKCIDVVAGWKSLLPINKEIKGELADKELIHEANYDYTAPNGFHNIVCKNTYQKRYEKLTKSINVQL